MENVFEFFISNVFLIWGGIAILSSLVMFSIFEALSKAFFISFLAKSAASEF